MAAPSAPAAGTAAIEEILVVGARLPRPVQDVVGTVDVITRDTLVEQIAVNAEDLVRYVPGVSVARADTRFGATEFTIRGLSGNRVTTLVDGVPVADQFDVGAFANAGQDYLTLDAVSRVEILRGPASTLFGSDALAGVVAVMTRDPEEYLGGEALAATASTAYSGADDATVVSGALAGRTGDLSGVLHASFLAADQTDAAGTSLEESLNRKRGAVMVKTAYALPRSGTLRVKAEAFEEQVDSRPEAIVGFGRQFRNTTYLAGDDRRTRRALQLEYAFGAAEGWVDDGRLIGFAQRSRTVQRTDERRDLLAPPVAIERRFDYRFDDVGVLLDLESRFELAGMPHRLGWGASVRRSKIEEQRDGRQRNLITGSASNVLLGETLPVRDFPITRVLDAAVYVHDEISLGAFTLIPGLRLEHYRLDADADSMFRADFPTADVVDVTETSAAPKLGLQWRLQPSIDLFAQYARGFRAPPFEDVNIGLDLAPFNVRAIANPDLRPETSDGMELGVRYRGGRFGLTATAFGAEYDDFIESRASLGVDPSSGVLLFQSRNIDRARVYGAELSLAARFTDTVDLLTTMSWTRGENRLTGEPLNTVDPPALTARLTWRPSGRWSTALALRAAAAQSRVDDSRVDLFEPDGYAVLDLVGGYAAGDRLRINVGVFNLTDRTYWHWASVRGRPQGDPLIEVLAAPGRFAAMSVHVAL